MPGNKTIFEPLWVDASDALEILEKKCSDGLIGEALRERLSHLIEFGWVVIPSAISIELADELSAEIDHVVDAPEFFVARTENQPFVHPTKAVYSDPAFRLLGYHVNSRLAQQAIFAPEVVEVLHAGFEEGVNAFQSLVFRYGSQQEKHQDGAYVVVSKPLQFMASWIALEDVTPGSGELAYYSGSHKLDDFLFPGSSKAWHPEAHGKQVHREFLDSLVSRCKAANLPLETFLPKKGDALIWASDLVHGGSRITNQNTRRSFVTHYCPVSVKPNFANFTKCYCEQRVGDNCYISSRHYDLRPDGLPTRLLNRLLQRQPYKRPIVT